MPELIAKYGDSLRYIKYYPNNLEQVWVLGIRGAVTMVDGRLMKAKDIKIYATTFEGLLV